LIKITFSVDINLKDRQDRSYVQARGGSCLLVPCRLNSFETQM